MEYDINNKPILDTYTLADNVSLHISTSQNAKCLRVSVHRNNVYSFFIALGRSLQSNNLNNGLPIEIEPIFNSVRKSIDGVVNTYDMPPNMLKDYLHLFYSYVDR